MNLRTHQRALHVILQGLDAADLPADILCDVVPGGGKSMLPGLLCERFPRHRLAWFVPRLSLARQAALGMLKDFGVEIRESGNDTNPSRGTRGFVATHAALTTDPNLWRHELSRHPYLLVIDELHHAKLTRGGVDNSLARAIAPLPYHLRLCMTGTLETNDSTIATGKKADQSLLELRDFEITRRSDEVAFQQEVILRLERRGNTAPEEIARLWSNLAERAMEGIQEVEELDRLEREMGIE